MQEKTNDGVMGKTYLHKQLAKAKQSKWKDVPLKLILWANRYNFDRGERRAKRNKIREEIMKKEIE